MLTHPGPRHELFAPRHASPPLARLVSLAAASLGVVLVTVLSTAGGGEPRARSMLSGGTRDEYGAAQMKADLGLEFGEVEPIDLAPLVEVRRTAAEAAGVTPKTLGRIELFRTSVPRGDRAERAEAVVARARLTRVGPAGRVVLLFVDGRLQTLSMWGNDEIDIDASRRWSAFLSQLARKAQSLPSPALGRIRHAVRRAGETETLEELGTTLLDLRVTMAANSLYGIATSQAADVLPSVEWFATLRGNMERVARARDVVAPVLGAEGAALLAQQATELAGLYDELARAAEEEDAVALGELHGVRNQACATCHGTLAGEGGPKLFDALGPAFEALDLRSGALRIGYDLAPALGDDGALSAEIADLARASLCLAELLAAGERGD